MRNIKNIDVGEINSGFQNRYASACTSSSLQFIIHIEIDVDLTNLATILVIYMRRD